jgi:hypothetical protein
MGRMRGVHAACQILTRSSGARRGKRWNEVVIFVYFVEKEVDSSCFISQPCGFVKNISVS